MTSSILQHEGFYRYGDSLGDQAQQLSHTINYIVCVEKTKGTRAGSDKEHGRTNFIALKSYVSEGSNHLLFPKSKVQLHLNGKTVYFNGDDFAESPGRSKKTVKNNFRLFPFPHTDFVESEFDTTKPNAIHEFGNNYDAAMTFLRSLTPQNMRTLLPSSAGEEPSAKQVVDGNKRKRPSKPNPRYSPNSNPIPKTVQKSMLKKAPISSTKMLARDSDEDDETVLSSQPTAKKAKKPVVGNAHRNQLLYECEVNPKKKLGVTAYKNATSRDIQAAIDADKKKKRNNLPTFPIAGTITPERDRSASPAPSIRREISLGDEGDVDEDDDYMLIDQNEQRVDEGNKIVTISPATSPLPAMDEDFNDETGKQIDNQSSPEEEKNGNREEEEEEDDSIIISSSVSPEPKLLEATGDFKRDMNALFGKIYDIEKSLFEIVKKTGTVQKSAGAEVQFLSPNESFNASDDIVHDVSNCDVDDNLIGDLSWCQGIDFPFKEPADVDEIDAQLGANKRQRHKLVRSYRIFFHTDTLTYKVSYFQYEFVVDNFLTDHPKLSVQKFLNSCFSRNFLAVKAFVKPVYGSKTRMLTPSKEHEKTILSQKQYLVMLPMLCK
jgi:hypothetical protein